MRQIFSSLRFVMLAIMILDGISIAYANNVGTLTTTVDGYTTVDGIKYMVFITGEKEYAVADSAWVVGLDWGSNIEFVDNIQASVTCKYSYIEFVGYDEHGNPITETRTRYLTCPVNGLTGFKNSGITGINIPSNIKSIGESAFSNCPNLKTVNLPSSITTIEALTFAECPNLDQFVIPNSVTTIKEYAFQQAHINSLTIPSSVTTIKFFGLNCVVSELNWNANHLVTYFYQEEREDDLSSTGICFSEVKKITIGNNVETILPGFAEGSRITEITFPNSVTSIGGGAFQRCNELKNVIIPNSVTSIGGGAFWMCRKLENVTIGNYSVTSIGDRAFSECSGLTNLTIGNSVTSIGEGAFSECSGLTNLTIGKSLTNIGGTAFYNCCNVKELVYNAKHCESWENANYYINRSVEKITIGNEVELLPNEFAKNSKITDISIPNSVTSIGREAFEYCDKLETVTIGDSVISIGNYAFDDCSALTNVIIPNSVTSIGEGAFSGCKELKNVTIGNSVTSIGRSAFRECSALTNVIIPNSVTSIDDGAFSQCSALTNVIIPNSITSIGNSVFHNCRELTNVIIPNSVTSIGRYAFYGCTELKNVTIGDSVTSIGDSAFGYCFKLETVTIPSSVTSIGEQAFSGLTSVTSLAVLPPSIKYYTFSRTTYRNATLHVPIESLQAYSEAEGWKEFQNIVAIHTGDIDGDGDVGINDLTTLIAMLLSGEISEAGDFNEDGKVSIDDVTALISYLLNSH